MLQTAQPKWPKPSTYLAARRTSRQLAVPNHPDIPVIESGVPLPVERRGGVRKFDHFYPFENMGVGDSFWVPSTTYCTAGAVTRFAKRTGWKFVTRAQTRDGKPNKGAGKAKRGTRVWRVA